MQVIVVGAGIVGCAVAYELAVHGARVRIIDPRGSGQGATRASAGILAPYIEGHFDSLLRLGICSIDQYDGFVERVSRDAGRTIEYRRTGTLQVALDAGEVRELEEQSRKLSEHGVPHSLVDADVLRRLEPNLTGDARAGLLISQHGYVHASGFVAALVAAALKRGATLSAGRVHAIDQDHRSPSVMTESETVAADAVVLAAGSWSGGVPVRLAPPPPVRPVRGQLVQLRSSEPALSTVVWGTGCYLVPWQDGSVLVGATVEEVGFDESVTAGAVRQLLDSAERLVPSLRSAAFVEARTGLRPASADGLPIIGPCGTMPGVFYATGHYRNGVLLAPLTATMVADLVLHGTRRSELELVRPDRFGL